MSIEIKVPDIGDFQDVDIVDVLVKPGDTVETEDPLISLETDKAVMDIPSPASGTVIEIKVSEGDTINAGDLILLLTEASDEIEEQAKAIEKTIEKPRPETSEKENVQADIQPEQTAPLSEASTTSNTEIIMIPDIGDFKDVNVVDILVAVGDNIEAEDPLISLETDKAVMDVPAPKSGVVTQIFISTDDLANEGDAILEISSTETAATAIVAQPSEATTPQRTTAPPEAAQSKTAETHIASKESVVSLPEAPSSNKLAHAGPAVRKLARKLGVDLSLVSGTGPHLRIIKEDVEQFVKQQLTQIKAASHSSSGFGIPAAKRIDFSQFGSIETLELTKINRLTGENTHASWLRIPHVTHHDKADITELEAFRKQENTLLKEQGIKLSLLPFLIKAAVASLKAFPRVNSSLDADGQSLILKQYYHISIAVDTPHGLMVPVIKHADMKSLTEIAIEVKALAQKAQNKRLSPADMQGGCFSLSSLGHIGGTGFTPIVNEPEVAIMGITRSELQPKYIDGVFVPRLYVPLSLSYDHRVVDGVLAAKFTRYFSAVLEDIRKLLV